MEIKTGKHEFYIEDDQNEKIARITYQFEDDWTIVANSTFVDPALRGQGVAKKLLDHLARYARDNNLKIRPLCSYVVKAFEKYQEYRDVAVD